MGDSSSSPIRAVRRRSLGQNSALQASGDQFPSRASTLLSRAQCLWFGSAAPGLECSQGTPHLACLLSQCPHPQLCSWWLDIPPPLTCVLPELQETHSSRPPASLSQHQKHSLSILFLLEQCRDHQGTGTVWSCLFEKDSEL